MTRRVVLGNTGDGEYGLRCSMPGFDVLTCDKDDPSQTSFNTEWTDFLKVAQATIATLPGTSGQVGTVTHVDLGFHPFIEAKYFGGNDLGQPSYYNDYIDGTGSQAIIWQPDTATVKVQVQQLIPVFSMFLVVYNWGYNSP